MPSLKSNILKPLQICIIIVFALQFTSCKKKDESQKIVYGTLALEVKVMHHSWGVPNIPLYLKKNAILYPGPDSSIYEIMTIADSDGLAIFENLYPGKYYLMAKGYDYYFGAEVLGSSPLNLTDPSYQNEPVRVTLMVSE